jgi:hypothetical protein
MTKKCVKKYVKKCCKKNDVNQNNSSKQTYLINKNTHINKINSSHYKSFLLEHDDDENEIVNWLEDDDNCDNKDYFDCGCCDECLCDDNIECSNCGCNCNGDEFDDDYDYEEDDDNENDDISNLSNFNINIIKNETDEKLVRITLQLNVMLDNKKTEIINIDLDINSKTYLKIAEELFKK